MERRALIAYKFLQKGGLGLFTGFRWPLPAGDAPGRWVEASAPLAVCSNGIHACNAEDLISWIDDELWVIELDGEIEEEDDVVVASRGRLLRPVQEWSAETARSFATDCVLRGRDRVAAALEVSGRTGDARRLEGQASLRDAQTYALALADQDETAAAAILQLFADTVALLEGRRPETAASGDVVEGVSDGAIAANIGFVVGHVFGTVAVDASGDPGTYDAAFAAERARQTAWLRDRLALDLVAA